MDKTTEKKNKLRTRKLVDDGEGSKGRSAVNGS